MATAANTVQSEWSWKIPSISLWIGGGEGCRLVVSAIEGQDKLHYCLFGLWRSSSRVSFPQFFFSTSSSSFFFFFFCFFIFMRGEIKIVIDRLDTTEFG